MERTELVFLVYAGQATLRIMQQFTDPLGNRNLVLLVKKGDYFRSPVNGIEEIKPIHFIDQL
ncbi:MAG: hypothetical protein WCR01_10540 [Bacteroidota bacterium]